MKRGRIIRNERIKLMLESGVSAAKIAEAVGVSVRTIYNHRAKWRRAKAAEIEAAFADVAALDAEIDAMVEALIGPPTCWRCGQPASVGIVCDECSRAELAELDDLAKGL